MTSHDHSQSTKSGTKDEAPAQAPSSSRASRGATGDAPTMLGALGAQIGSGVLQAKLQRRAVQRRASAASAEAAAPTAGDSGGGAALPGETRATMERSMGADFSGVRVHVGDKAPAMGALAFTQGNDVHFAPGQYQPGSTHGDELLGHELAHVVQQRQGRVQASGQAKEEGLPEGVPLNNDASLEAEADRAGARAARGEPAGLGNEGGATAASTAGPVQRYKDAGDVTATQAEGEDVFTSHDSTPSISDDPRQGLAYKRSHEQNPMVVSDDEAMAIQKDLQAQEFFALPGLVEGWNEKLAATGTKVRLAERESTITVGKKTMTMIKPTLDDKEFDSLVQNECFEVANMVLGKNQGEKTFEAIFQGTDQDATEAERLIFESKQSKDVASTMLSKDGGVGRMDKALGKGSKGLVGKKYGEALGGGDLDEKSKKLGVNENALPDVGEAYVTFSVREGQKTEDKGLTDYTQLEFSKNKLYRKLRETGAKAFRRLGEKSAPRLRQKSWDMHYAGVVAVSPTGSDRVTLEDYNRNDELAELRKPLYEKLIEQYGEQLREKMDNMKTASDVLVELAMSIDKMSWIDAKQLVNGLLTATGKSSWYMKMFGTRKEQSFHQLSHEGGDTVNPLTMRVGKRTEKK